VSIVYEVVLSELVIPSSYKLFRLVLWLLWWWWYEWCYNVGNDFSDWKVHKNL